MLKKLVRFILLFSLLFAAAVYIYDLMQKEDTKSVEKRKCEKRLERGWVNRQYLGSRRKYSRRGLVRRHR